MGVKRFVQHESYVSHIHDYDFSLLELDQALSYSDTVQAAKLPGVDDDEIKDGTLCFTSGWGNYFQFQFDAT